ncbi:hypothetical protein TNIN_167121 [Trichonephila inaurata madagascariensis]|uniref:Uncharacterized protein n=1 Tax=Trichonephila inaurata madagascariensis TaxID=2747483 RepID=A0A8X6WUG2_9ARAC|nr:hypothetical protein TNIN_167121 [Trichonephila inaurata madagascariensis]
MNVFFYLHDGDLDSKDPSSDILIEKRALSLNVTGITASPSHLLQNLSKFDNERFYPQFPNSNGPTTRRPCRRKQNSAISFRNNKQLTQKCTPIFCKPQPQANTAIGSGSPIVDPSTKDSSSGIMGYFALFRCKGSEPKKELNPILLSTDHIL